MLLLSRWNRMFNSHSFRFLLHCLLGRPDRLLAVPRLSRDYLRLCELVRLQALLVVQHPPILFLPVEGHLGHVGALEVHLSTVRAGPASHLQSNATYSMELKGAVE